MHDLKLILLLLVPAGLIMLESCEKNIPVLNPDYEYLKGTWIDYKEYKVGIIVEK